MALNIYINSQTGDYEFYNGSLLNKNALYSQIYMRLACIKGTFINDLTFGIDLPQNSKARFTKNQIIQKIQEALSPLFTNGDIISMKVDIVTAILGKYVANIQVVDHNNTLILFDWRAITS